MILISHKKFTFSILILKFVAFWASKFILDFLPFYFFKF
ncbi:Hypothetical Protein MfeM64YM_0184 [Mycoplasmopsis fermentans M64]|uniref:Uncharacterized protein n=1 Tax=Mycoplasmopsis fermentans (strain M64) TaxID=943945 RepID=A0AB32XB20_MYCFM|nr:Hypothetical Protein MfeM64YM_0184 [Mycoplasmopsis fermentans M64]